MTTRAYDYIVNVANSSNFTVGNTVFGLSSNTVAEIVSIEGSNLKVRLSNIYSEFSVGEVLRSNSALLYSVNAFQQTTTDYANLSVALPVSNALADSVTVYIDNQVLPKEYYTVTTDNVVLDANYTTFVNSISTNTDILVQVVTGNTNAHSFISNNMYSQVTTANSEIVSIFSAPYIAEKNSVEQTPIVRLYTIYYPGEWYPKNSNGNPSKTGEGYPWPFNFPLRYAEFLGETYGDFNYSISMNNTEYRVIAMNGGEISTDDSGTINGTALDISNFDGVISSLVDNPNIVGYNSSNSVIATVNGELVKNIDPRTVPGNFFYDSDVAAQRGTNAAWDYSSSIANGDTWVSLKDDSRDLLGAIVEIKMTYAKFLDYWPEYSRVTNVNSNIITVQSSTPYRIGDTVYTNTNATSNVITAINGNNIYVDVPATTGSMLLISNPDADPQAFVEHVFVINRLEELNDFLAKFSLTNWLQYFKMSVPKRKFYKATCPWVYKGTECKYPANGSGPIIGSNPPITSNGFFTYSNVPTLNDSEDICAKTLTACSLRRNLANFGGFSGET